MSLDDADVLDRVPELAVPTGHDSIQRALGSHSNSLHRINRHLGELLGFRSQDFRAESCLQ